MKAVDIINRFMTHSEDDVREVVVDGKTIYIRRLTAAEFSDIVFYENQARDKELSASDRRNAEQCKFATAFKYSLCDEDGKQLFDNSDFDALKNRFDARAAILIYSHIINFNMPSDLELKKKN